MKVNEVAGHGSPSCTGGSALCIMYIYLRRRSSDPVWSKSRSLAYEHLH
jgi:hypothetical protein